MSHSTIPLEDDACDVISKAMRGLEISPGELAKLTGLNDPQIHAALKGQHSDEVLKRIAPALHLSTDALVGLVHYQPIATAPEKLIRFVTPFGHAGVNAYAIIGEKHALVFDTGTDAAPITGFLKEHELALDTLYVTHRHHDHTAGVHDFDGSRIIYPENMEHGSCREIQPGHTLTALDVSGHTDPARAYFYQGLDVPVCIIGDSMFAGSMGGTPNAQSYQQALQTATEHLLTLPANTILCPGHGPLSTVASERTHNSFLAEEITPEQ